MNGVSAPSVELARRLVRELVGMTILFVLIALGACYLQLDAVHSLAWRALTGDSAFHERYALTVAAIDKMVWFVLLLLAMLLYVIVLDLIRYLPKPAPAVDSDQSRSQPLQK